MNEFINTHELASCTLPFYAQSIHAQTKKERKILKRRDKNILKKKCGEFFLLINNMSKNENAKAKAPEKSDFTRRCSLLSRYLKEKGSFGNIDLGLLRKPDSNIGLLGTSDPPGTLSSLPLSLPPLGK